MKVISEVRNKADGPLYYFSARGYDIPVGARVTIEWDENLHKCKESEAAHIRVERIVTSCSSEWRAVDELIKVGQGKGWIGPILYCPCCGMKLEECK